MKRWYGSILVLLILVLVVGQVVKVNFRNCGIATIKTYDDIYALDCGMSYIFGESSSDEVSVYNSLVEYEEDYISDSDYAPIIIIGEPTGKYSQDSLSFGQEVLVEAVIKGDGIEEGEKYYMYGTDGFITDENQKVLYSNIKNIMKEGEEYLIFLEPSELNGKVPEKVFFLSGTFFNYLHINYSSDIIIEKEINNLKFNDLKDFEYFTKSKRILDRIYLIKEKIINKYI